MSPVTAKDLDTAARTLFGESEPHDVPDAIAIAWVIKNRVALPNWPNSVTAVCMQPKQFSCWNDNDPMREKIIAVDKNNKWFVQCSRIATDVLVNDSPPDPTHRATHYYATWLKKAPKWARGKTPCYEPPKVGKWQHVFFNDIDTPPPKNAAEALDQAKPITESKTMQASGTLVAVGSGSATKGAVDGDYWLIGIGVLVLVLGLVVGGLRMAQRKKGEQ